MCGPSGPHNSIIFYLKTYIIPVMKGDDMAKKLS